MKIYSVYLLLNLLFLLSAVTQSNGQNAPDQFGYIAYSVKVRGNLINFHVYARENSLSRKKPLFIYLQGSGAEPIFQKSDRGTLNQLFISPKDVRDQYYYVVIDKPAIPFVSSGKFEVPQQYHDLLTRLYRAEAASAVINHLLKMKWVDKTKVVVAGHSEGARVVPLVARLNRHVTHIGIFAGGGLTQMFNFVTNVRKDVRSGKMSAEEGEAEIKKLDEQFRAIYADRNSATKMWLGHSYKRWASFFEPPLDDLLKLNVPTYLSANTEDVNESVERADMIYLEFLRQGKTNLTYKVNWNCDHFYMCKETTAGQVKTISRREQAISDFMTWLCAPDKALTKDETKRIY